MNIVDKALPDLTRAEYKCVYSLNFGYNGYMQEFLVKRKNDPESRAIMIYRDEPKAGSLLGWALLIPTRRIECRYGPTRYSKRRSKYALQLYVRANQRRKGYARTLMQEALKYDDRPYVWPHDLTSGDFYSNYSVTVNRFERRTFLKKRKRIAA